MNQRFPRCSLLRAVLNQSREMYSITDSRLVLNYCLHYLLLYFYEQYNVIDHSDRSPPYCSVALSRYDAALATLSSEETSTIIVSSLPGKYSAALRRDSAPWIRCLVHQRFICLRCQRCSVNYLRFFHTIPHSGNSANRHFPCFRATVLSVIIKGTARVFSLEIIDSVNNLPSLSNNQRIRACLSRDIWLWADYRILRGRITVFR